MIKYAKIKGYKNLGEVGMTGTHLYQWIEDPHIFDAIRHKAVIIVRAYDIDKPVIFKGVVFNRTLRYYPLEITEDLSDLESIVGELTVVDLKDISDILSQYKLIIKRG